MTKEKLFGAGISIISTGHYVIVPNVTIPNVTIPNVTIPNVTIPNVTILKVTIPKLVKIPNINRNPTIPPTKLGEGEILSSYPE